MVSKERIIEVLETAKSIVSHDGWWGQGNACTTDPDAPGVCATGAVAVVTGDIKPVKWTKDELVFGEAHTTVPWYDPNSMDMKPTVSEEYQQAVMELGITATKRHLAQVKREGDTYYARDLQRELENMTPGAAENAVVGVNDSAGRRRDVLTLFTTTINRLKKELQTA